MVKLSRIRRQMFIFIVDCCILILSVFLSLFIRKGFIYSDINFYDHIKYFLPTIFCWELFMYIFEFYILEKVVDLIRMLISLSFIALITMFFGVFTFYIFFYEAITPKTIMALFIFLSYVLIFLWRYLYNVLFSKINRYPKVLFIGFNDTVFYSIKKHSINSSFGYSILGIYDSNHIIDSSLCGNITILKEPNELKSFLKVNSIDIVVLNYNYEISNSLRNILFSFLNKNILIYSLPKFYELVNRKIPLDDLNDAWILSEMQLYSKKIYLIIKRCFDIFFSLLFLLLTFPLFIFVSILIKFDSLGPVFFTQIREGKNGRPFSIIKFRTMKIFNNDFSPTIQNDSRVTKVGNFLRKSRLDELPQIINILRGEMSLIGPRPERPEISTILEKNISFYKQRLLIKPGLTGWDQVSGEYHSPSIEDTIKKMEYDLYYIKNMSFFLDISIFFKTLSTIFKRSGR